MTSEEKLKLFVGLWAGENSIKTNKLSHFFVVQSILVAVLALGTNTGLHWIASVLGIVASCVSYFSIGRTIAFQKIWKGRIDGLLEGEPELQTFHVFPGVADRDKIPLYGKVPSVIIVLSPPLLALILWIIALTYQVTTWD